MTEQQRLIHEILECGFECEAGKLKNLTQFKDLKRLIDEDAAQYVKEGKHIKLKFPLQERPVCVFDLETTGKEPDKDRIVQISVLKIMPNGKKEHKTRLINPGISIPKEATDIHGITDEMVKDAPLFVSISKELHNYIDGCDIIGFNSNKFDVPMLYFSFDRVGLSWDWRKVNLIDVSNIFRINEERTLSAAVKFYLGRKHEEAHSADGDVLATLDILLAQFVRYPEVPKDFKDLALYSNYGKEIVDMAGKFVKNEAGEICFTFGPHVGEPAKNHKGFLNWMQGKDFNKDTLNIAKIILLEP